MADNIKLYLAITIVLASLAAFYTYTEFSLLYRTIGLIVMMLQNVSGS